MKQAKIYVVQVTEAGTARVAGGALTEDNAVILADKFADAVINTGAIPKVTPRGYDTPTGTEPREIRGYEGRRGAGFPQVVISVLEMLEETNPEY